MSMKVLTKIEVQECVFSIVYGCLRQYSIDAVIK